MNIKKRIAALTLAAAMAAGTVSSAMADNAVKDDLVAQMAAGIHHDISVDLGEGATKYTNLETVNWTEAQPAYFDLRDRGTVPAVRSQGTLGTCWSFGSIAACEISILNSLNMTTEEFAAANGVEMNLSERHLAWFSSLPLPEGRGQEQAGEGRFMFDPDIASVEHYQIGGTAGFVSGMLASGMGPVYEIVVPYENNEGTDSMAGDWSVDENLRFASMFDLKDSSILPSPADRDEQGNYVYNPIATAMIKSELLKGRAVSISYFADQAMDPDTQVKYDVDMLVEQGYDPRYSELVVLAKYNRPIPEDLSEEDKAGARRLTTALILQVPFEDVTDEMIDYVQAYIDAQIEARAAAQAEAPDEEELAAAAAQAQADAMAKIESVAAKLDADPARIAEGLGALNGTSGMYFMNWDTYAQYVSADNVPGNHLVTIVGYDDNYPIENFRADNPPPAPGAWIVRNSWGAGYGNAGYFYLSYYDKTINGPESFEFVTDVDAMTASELYIHQYDYMPVAGIQSALTSEPVYMANEFTVHKDSVLSYVSAMTANYGTNVTVAVYLLNEDAKTPTDGKLLDVRTVNYDYAGYHRIALNQHYLLSAGTRISVVQTQRIQKDNNLYYVLPFAYATNRAFGEVQNELPYEREIYKATSAVNGVINHGESFLCVDNEWNDWADVIDNVKAADTLVDTYCSFDNISIKAYFYMLSDITGEHKFGEAVPYAGGTVKLCTECGYALVEQ